MPYGLHLLPPSLPSSPSILSGLETTTASLLFTALLNVATRPLSSLFNQSPVAFLNFVKIFVEKECVGLLIRPIKNLVNHFLDSFDR